MKPWEVGRLFQLHHDLIFVFGGDHRAAEHWLMREQPRFDGKRPCELVVTVEGYQQVADVVAKLHDEVQAKMNESASAR